MIRVSEIMTTAPESFKTELQKKVYETLSLLKIPYERVESDEVITMEDCAAVNEKLDMNMVKTLFLSNRRQTECYLFITEGEKPFSSKNFSTALGISRVSFAPKELMEEKLQTVIGAATVFSALLPSAKDVTVVFDNDVLKNEYYGCSDGTTTGYMKIKTEKITGDFLKFTGRKLTVVEV
ncbi:MAG: YbaK/EbsC family protein [Clostridia bacterium]|nr:YbaK/EbsC family protein [Clostridia bacterium]